MNIRTDDYVTLKSFEEVKPFYKFCDMVNDGTVITNTDYFTAEMLDAMGTSNKYRVIEANQGGIWIDVEGTVFGFEKKCIKDIYRLTKVK